MALNEPNRVVLRPAKPPLELLPVELWTIILDKVSCKPRLTEDLSHVASCSQVCSDFRKILEPTRTSWLFHKVFPLIFGYLPKKQVIGCRQVCKSWTLGVDTFLEHHPFHTPYTKETSCHLLRSSCDETFFVNMPVFLMGGRLSLEYYHFTKIETITSFRERLLPNSTRNPFVGRSVWLRQEDSGGDSSDEDDEDEDLHYGSATNRFWMTVEFVLLSRCGEHIWHLTLTPVEFSFNSDNYPLDFVHLMQRLLRHVPNLRSLTFDGWIAVTREDDQSGPLAARESLASRPLPYLQHLVTLGLSRIQNLPPCISTALINRHGDQLRRLDLNIPRGDFDQGFKLEQYLPNLCDLKLEIDSISVLTTLLDNLKTSSNPPLAKLHLNFVSYLDSSAHQESLFDAVGKFSATLQVLVLQFLAHFQPPDFFVCPSPSTVKLFQSNAPRLKYLKLDCQVTLPVVRFTHPRDLSKEGSIYDSALWTIIPTLRAVSCELTFDSMTHNVKLWYSRETYEYRKKQRDSNN